MTVLIRSRRGSASVEAALSIALVLLPLTFGMIDFGEAITQASRLDRAYDAALYYVWANPGSITTANLQAAAQAAYGSATPPLTVNAGTACWCVTAGYTKAGAVASTATCPSGQSIASYVTIATSIRFPLPAAFPGLASPVSLAVQGTVRSQ